MGGQQSTVEIREKESHAERRKRVSTAVQKSREKYLSTVLSTSEPDLTATPEEIADAHATGNDAKEVGIADNGLKPGSGSGSGSLAAPKSASPTVRFSDCFTEINRDSVFYHQSESSSSSSSSEDDVEDDAVEEDSMVVTKQPSLRLSPKARKSTCKISKRRKKTFHPLGRYDRSSSFHDEVDYNASKTEPSEFTYFFENLVFEGGGNKGLAYCGAVRYLEELGLMDNISRFAGASAGAMVAGLLAVGYTSHDIQQFLSDRIDKVFLDASCGYLSLLPNILNSFGWNPGTKIYDWFGDKLKDKTGDADFTFMELYKKRQKTLCIIVTNLNQMTTEYCHPKTTPDMPIRLALRMSMAIPGLFSAMKYRHLGQEDVYVDGGVLCNFPVHCFDGWYLSMEPKDSFLRRLHPLHKIPKLMERNRRFRKVNDKTLGMLLYSDAEEDMLRMSLEKRVGCLQPAKPEPETKLYDQRSKELRQRQRAEREYHAVVKAVDSFLRVLQKHNIDGNDIIDIHELEAAFKDEDEFPRHEAEALFGKDCTVNQAFQRLDTDGNGQIHYHELLHFIEETGVSIQSRFLGHRRREIKSFVSFLSTLQSTLTFNVQKLYVGEGDLDRTVGINTGHVHTTDFVLEEPDREFVVLRGYNSMKSFLKYYAVCHPDKVQRKGEGQATEQCPDIQEDQEALPTNNNIGAAAASARANAVAAAAAAAVVSPAMTANGTASGRSEIRQPLVTAQDCALGLH